MQGMRKRNLLAAIVLIALGVIYGVLTSNLPTRNIENATGPSFFPWIITVCFLSLSIVLLIQGILPMVSDIAPTASGVPRYRYLSALVVALVYLAVLPELGFIVASIPLYAALMWLYGERRPLWIIGGSVIVTVTTFFLFRDIFQIRLPSGIL
jgi:hypothetical protein